MLSASLIGRLLAAALAVLGTNTSLLQAKSPQDRFYQAYYLEHANRDYAAAAQLYAKTITSSEADIKLRSQAKARLAVCREEVACADFIHLMPPNPLAYVEINRPGERLRKLIDQLGLLADSDESQAGGENRLAISPAIIDAVLGMRGMAVAVTGFDMMTQTPSGVLVFHPGSVELVRGLIETALPAGCQPVQSISGYPTYEIEGFYITLTARLVVAGSSPAEIEAVIERLNSPNEDSLATNTELAEILQERDDALLFFCVNPKPLMPILNGMLIAGAAQNHELAIAQALLDIQSLHSLSGRFDVSDQGLRLDLALRLDEGHRNLVYNLLRRPALDPETLRCIPTGVAGFFAMALNEAPSSYDKPRSTSSDDQAIVTAWDFGRELFANINGIAVYVLPPAETGIQTREGVPDITGVITVNDPTKSEALWNQILGFASLATGGAVSMEGTINEIKGVPVRSYRFDDNLTIHFATFGHDLFIASSETALKRSLQAKHSGKSILDDAAFADSVSRLGPHTTIAMLAHPGRCAAVAKPFMSPDEVQEMEPFISLMTDTVVAVVVNHSGRMLHMSAAVTGIPDISEFVSRMITEELQREQHQQRLQHALRQKDWDQVGQLLDEQIAAKPHNQRLLKSKFNLLAVHKKDRPAALAFADQVFERISDDPGALNSIAWELLTEDKYEHAYDELALRLSHRSNELTGHANWYYVDTLALAEFQAGCPKKAVELEEKAIKICQRTGSGRVKELESALTRYQTAVQEE